MRVRKLPALALLFTSANVAVHAADLPANAAAIPYTQSPWVNLFGGVAASPDAIYGYAGATYALNQDLQRDGFLLRVDGGDGEYSYLRTIALRQNVSFQNGDFAVGYQSYFNGIRVSGYLGANIESNNNTDPSAVVEGTKWGIKGQADIYAPLGRSFFAYVLGSYSTVWSNYLIMGKLGYRLTDAVSIGPELMGLGNVSWDSVRTGPFISYSLTARTDLIVSGGYSWDTRAQGIFRENGAYGSLYVSTKF